MFEECFELVLSYKSFSVIRVVFTLNEIMTKYRETGAPLSMHRNEACCQDIRVGPCGRQCSLTRDGETGGRAQVLDQS